MICFGDFGPALTYLMKNCGTLLDFRAVFLELTVS